MQDEWKSVDALPRLGEHDLQIWRLELSDDASLSIACTSYLTDDEQARAERRRVGRGREEFVIGRACLRVLLGDVLGVAPVTVPLIESPYGKPEVSIEGCSLSFNVTHSRGTIVIAILRYGVVGVDVEHINQATDVMDIANGEFTENERSLLISLESPEARRLAFYRCWTQKEAVVKADGRGLSLPLSCFDVPVHSAERTPVQIKELSGEMGKLYFLSDIEVGKDLVGAIATDSPNCRMSLLNFPISVLKNRL